MLRAKHTNARCFLPTRPRRANIRDEVWMLTRGVARRHRARSDSAQVRDLGRTDWRGERPTLGTRTWPGARPRSLAKLSRGMSRCGGHRCTPWARPKDPGPSRGGFLFVTAFGRCRNGPSAAEDRARWRTLAGAQACIRRSDVHSRGNSFTGMRGASKALANLHPQGCVARLDYLVTVGHGSWV